MNLRYFLSAVVAFAWFACPICNAASPTVTNVVAHQASDGSHQVIITYNLYDPDSSSVNVSLSISNNGGSTYTITPSHVSGAIGWGVRPGNGKKIVWDCGADLPGVAGTNYKAKIIASDIGGGVNPGEMIYIPAGTFPMGYCGDIEKVDTESTYFYSSEKPQHSVYLPGYGGFRLAR